MEFEVEILLEKPILPIEYRKLILAFIKDSLSLIDEKLIDEYYGEARKKDFSFFVSLSGPKFYKDIIELKSTTFKIGFSSYTNCTSLNLLNSMIKRQSMKKNFKFTKDNSIKITNIYPIKETKITKENVILKILSPLVIRKHEKVDNKDWYVSVKQSSFEQELKIKLKEDLENNKDLLKKVDDLIIFTGNAKKTIIKHYGTCIESTIGEIGLHGDPKLLDEICKRHIGSRKSAGFGYVKPKLQWSDI